MTNPVRPHTEKSDRVSLITTVLNEGASIQTFLRGLEHQTRPPDEIIIVDGGSTDDTLTQIEAWSLTSTIRVTCSAAPGCNISTGRNLAIASASGDLIAVTDAGTQLRSDWLATLLRALTDDVSVVSGFFEPVGNSVREKAIAFAITPRVEEIDPSTFLPSSRSVLFRRQAWVDAGGYPEWLDYCEDLVFDLAMKASGAEFAFASGAIATWSGRPDLRSFAKTYYRYARGDGKAGLWSKRHAARYGAYALGVILAGKAPVSPAARAVLALGTTAYFRKFIGRVITRRGEFGSVADATRAVALVPVIVVTGDVAKMIGYPVGRRWRAQNRPDT